MKKLLVITSALVITSITSFAQGNVATAGGVNGIWNDTNGVVGVSKNWGFVTLLFSTSSSYALSAITPSGGTATNGTTSFNTTTAWSDISTMLSGTWFQVMGATNGAGMVGQASPSLNGTFAYNAGASWVATNVNSGTAYSVIEVAWTGPFTTLAAAIAGGSYLGWSQEFSFTPTSGATQPTVINPANNVGFFGIEGTVTVVPEPSTMALAGLGGAALLLFRRRSIK